MYSLDWTTIFCHNWEMREHRDFIRYHVQIIDFIMCIHIDSNRLIIICELLFRNEGSIVVLYERKRKPEQTVRLVIYKNSSQECPYFWSLILPLPLWCWDYRHDPQTSSYSAGQALYQRLTFPLAYCNFLDYELLSPIYELLLTEILKVGWKCKQSLS